MAETVRKTVALFKSSEELAPTDDRYLSLLEENGFFGIVVPTLSFQFQVDTLRASLLQPNKYSGMILTSQRSVEAVNAAVECLPNDWNEKLNFCVGRKTGETASKILGLTKLMGQDCGNAENLSAVIIKEHEDDHLPLPLLFPCSNLRMDTLPRTLEEHNISLDIITSYVTLPHFNLKENIMKLTEKIPEFIVFFSPSGVNFSLPFLKEHNLISSVKVVSIGLTTASALQCVDICVDQICSKPTPEALLESLKSLI